MYLAVIVVFLAALAGSILVDSAHSLTRPTSCGGTVMSPYDGCEVLRGGSRSRDMQLYWPDGLLASFARSMPADRHLKSRAQMHSDTVIDGITGVLMGSGLLALAVMMAWWTIRGWRRRYPSR